MGAVSAEKTMSAAAPELRELNNDELDELLNLYRFLHEEDEALPDRTVVKDVWQQIQTGHGMHCFGLFCDGALASSCILVMVPNLTRGCRPYGVIENVVTHAAYRGRGFGRRIMRHALDYAWAEKCYKVMLMTGRRNEATYRFYESIGFRRDEKQAFIARP